MEKRNTSVYNNDMDYNNSCIDYITYYTDDEEEDDINKIEKKIDLKNTKTISFTTNVTSKIDIKLTEVDGLTTLEIKY